MSKPKSIFMTGATGFLGSHLAARYLEAGNRVTALARGSKNSSPETRVNIRFARCDQDTVQLEAMHGGHLDACFLPSERKREEWQRRVASTLGVAS